VAEGDGENKQVLETSCCTAVWQMATQALSPLAMHCSFRATKSFLVTVGVDEDGGMGSKIGGKVLGCASTRNKLGAAREPTPSTPSEGGRGGSEASAVSRPAYTCHQPHGLAWEGCCVQAAADHPAGPSKRGEGVPPPPLSRGGEAAGSMAGVTSQREEKGSKQGTHTRGVSSELRGVSSELGGVSSELRGHVAIAKLIS
jgi:hypothetical protein